MSNPASIGSGTPFNQTSAAPPTSNSTSQKPQRGSFPNLGFFSLIFGPSKKEASQAASTQPLRARSAASSTSKVRSYFFPTVKIGGFLNGTRIPKNDNWSLTAGNSSNPVATKTINTWLGVLNKNGKLEGYNTDKARIEKINPQKANLLESNIKSISKEISPSYATTLADELRRHCYQDFLGTLISHVPHLECFQNDKTYLVKGDYDCTFSFYKQSNTQIMITVQAETVASQLENQNHSGRKILTSQSKQFKGTITLQALATVDSKSGKITQLEFHSATGTRGLVSSSSWWPF